MTRNEKIMFWFCVAMMLVSVKCESDVQRYERDLEKCKTEIEDCYDSLNNVVNKVYFKVTEMEKKKWYR